MSPSVHPAAAHHLPFFVTPPGETDVLFIVMAVFVLVSVVGIGLVYVKLHALPEQLAHRGQKIQFELVAVLALLALFTHNHAFWIAGLLLALVPLPDFTTPLSSVARSLERIAASADADRGGAAAPVTTQPAPAASAAAAPPMVAPPMVAPPMVAPPGAAPPGPALAATPAGQPGSGEG